MGPLNLRQLEQIEAEGGADDDRIGMTWGYGNLLVCLNCIGVDCMIDGCNERATVGIQHWFDIGESGSVLDKPFRVQMRNDLWFCAGHVSSVKNYRIFRLLRNGLLTVGVLGLGAAFISDRKALPALAASAGLIGGGVFWSLMKSFATRNGLIKKNKYIESVQVPLELDPGSRSAKGPWLDDMLYG